MPAEITAKIFLPRSKDVFLKSGPFRRYPRFGRCIYCGATSNLSDEHIVPFSLGGNVVLPEASCSTCAAITSQFERLCARTMMGPLRARMRLQTRRKKDRPTNFTAPVTNLDGSRADDLQFDADSYPVVCMGIRLDPPRMIKNLPLSDRVTGEWFTRQGLVESEAILKPGQTVELGKIQMEGFCRLIAKIGHAHVMAALANEGSRIEHRDLFLPEIILGRSPYFQHFVGGDDQPLDAPKALHQLRFDRYVFNDRRILVSTVRLFALFGMPRYHVIACYEPTK